MKMRCFKLTNETGAALTQHNANLSKAIREIATTWDQAGRPELPDADGTNGTRITQRHDAATWAIVTAAGDGNASAGVRRLAAWMQAQTTDTEAAPKTGTLQELVDGVLDLLERTPADDPLFQRLKPLVE